MNNKNKLEEEVQAELVNGDFSKKIKDKCAWCGARILATADHYSKYGNSCVECSARHSKLSKGIVGQKRVFNKKSKRHSWQNYKIRDFTEEERLKMLKERLDEVNELGLSK